jgi:hypothetical protein
MGFGVATFLATEFSTIVLFIVLLHALVLALLHEHMMFKHNVQTVLKWARQVPAFLHCTQPAQGLGEHRPLGVGEAFRRRQPMATTVNEIGCQAVHECIQEGFIHYISLLPNNQGGSWFEIFLCT